MNQDDDEFEQRVRSALERDTSALDADTRRALATGRARALEQKSLLARWLPAGNWLPATAFACCAVVATALYVGNQHAEEPLQMAQSDAEFALELLFSEGNADAESDPDFYIAMDAMLYEEEQQHAG